LLANLILEKNSKSNNFKKQTLLSKYAFKNLLLIKKNKVFDKKSKILKYKSIL
jgi:hypothetical protein